MKLGELKLSPSLKGSNNMGEFRSSSSPKDRFIRVDCKRCYKTNFFFLYADTKYIKKKKANNVFHIAMYKRCDGCGAYIPVQEYDNCILYSEATNRDYVCRKNIHTYYESISNEDIKSHNYILSKDYKFSKKKN